MIHDEIEIETEDYAFEMLNPPIKKVTALLLCHEDILLGSKDSKQESSGVR
jgi:hypothetical protein